MEYHPLTQSINLHGGQYSGVWNTNSTLQHNPSVYIYGGQYSGMEYTCNCLPLSIWGAIFWFIEYSLFVPPSNTIHQSIWRAISWFMAYLLFVPPPTQYSSLYGGQYPAEWNNYQYNSLSHSPAHCKFWLQGKVRSSVESCYSSTLVGQSKINQNYLTCSHCLWSVVSNSYGKCHIFNVATISKCMHSNTCNQNCCFII